MMTTSDIYMKEFLLSIRCHVGPLANTHSAAAIIIVTVTVASWGYGRI